MSVLYSVTQKGYLQGIRTCRHLLQKAVEHSEANSLNKAEIPQWRLVEDMLPLIFQIQSVCNGPKKMFERLGMSGMPYAADDETTIEQLFARLDVAEKMVAELAVAQKSAMDGVEGKDLVVDFGSHGSATMNAVDCVANYAIPNFWFHVTVLYSILRLKGVDLGKRDFLSHSGMQIKKPE